MTIRLNVKHTIHTEYINFIVYHKEKFLLKEHRKCEFVVLVEQWISVVKLICIHSKP